jgi:beta-galactosidase GanA
MNRTLGVCYYPEHWPESQWTEDAERMAALGLTHVRIGEFAWSRLEPKRGTYEFDWLRRAIDTLHQAGLKVVLGHTDRDAAEMAGGRDAGHAAGGGGWLPARVWLAPAL